MKKPSGRRSEFVVIFGYGSLLNQRTHRRPDISIYPFRLTGWQREWGHCVDSGGAGKVCALTIRPNRRAEVSGAFVVDLRANLRDLDEREQGYRRVRIFSRARPSIPNIPANATIFTYTSDPPEFRPGSREFPIWRSYLECVLAGFLDVGGKTAARDFVVTTRGWESPILDDRTAPKYMRATSLPAGIQTDVDALIQEHGLERTQF